jgi:predicted N-acetyltransferase YhbS
LPWPEGPGRLLGWGAFQPAPDGEALVGAVVAEPTAHAALIHGPVVVAERDALQIAAELVGAILDHAVAAGAATIFARPQGLDRIWVRFGFIPVPEGTLPEGLSRHPGDGLYAWRGGSAIWSLRRVESA